MKHNFYKLGIKDGCKKEDCFVLSPGDEGMDYKKTECKLIGLNIQLYAKHAAKN